MKKFMLGIALALAVSACSANDSNGNVEDLGDIMLACDVDGYFLLRGVLYMCLPIEHNVTIEDVKDEEHASSERHKKRWMERHGF